MKNFTFFILLQAGGLHFDTKIIRFRSELQLAIMQCCYFKKHIFFSPASVFASVDCNTVDYITQHHCR